ncbi:SLBB domain-containing protein [Rhodohalobacter sp. 8-1]|uniref:SLBB domain-containing protein n=1 Tax=Rhodohalobacter sp. 8-1 TaxID=3131972 RepID=UPI0030EF77B3
MKFIRLSGVFAALFCLLFTIQLNAQNLGGIDFASVNVDDLSDAQIRQVWERAQEENLGVQEISALAQSRGMPAAEVSKLQSRLNQVRSQTDSDVSETQTGSLRQVETMTEGGDDMVRTSAVEQPDRQLRVFGSNLFRDRSITFEPSFNIPTPIDYTLGVGDEIVINIWGAAEANYDLTITPEGVVRIPSLGPIQLSGLSIQDARDRILSRLQDIYSGLRPNNPQNATTYADVSLGNVRSIKVTILGEVNQPGTYTISSLATVFNALYASGGPTNSGTFRDIQIIRGNEIAATLDIYDFLVYGDQCDNIRLRDQDIIKIDPYISRVELRGEVKQPAVFEMTEDETLADLIEYASGFTDRAFTRRLVLRRNTDIQRSISDVRWPEGADLVLRSGDEIRVGELLDRYENRVSIRGAVFREGEYELDEDMMLTDLIEKASGLREDAYMQRGVIFRTQDDLTVRTLAFSVADVMNGVSDDITLRRDDIVQISSLFDLREEYTIQVSGAVNEGGEFAYVENLTISDAIYLADGFRESAAPYRIELSRRLTGEDRFTKGNQLAERFSFDIDENLEFDTGDEDFKLQPFDQILVRTMPNYRAQQSVQIQGEVNFPGSYVLDSRDARISDLIEWAGGMSEFAYPEGASLSRDPNGDEQTLRELESLDEEIQLNRRGSSKVGIRLVDIMRNPGSADDLKLEPGDVLEIPAELQTVRVEGEVLFPVQVRYEDGLSLRDAVDKAGGYTDQALKKRAYVVYANGEVDRSKRFLFFRNNPPIEPGATIVIPTKEEAAEMSPQERIAIYSTIISMAAIVTNTIFQIRR